MRTAGEIQRAEAIELLSERLLFARAAVELLELVQARIGARGGPYESVRAHLWRMREEKQAQCEWLEEQLRLRGRDPGRLPAGHSLAVMQAEAAPAQMFESLLRAEIYDAGGWEALLDHAARAADDGLAEQMRQMLREEEEHLLYVSRVVARFARDGRLEDAPIVVEAAPG